MTPDTPKRSPATLRTRWLGKLAKDLRERSGLTLKDAGDHIGKAGSMVSRMESGGLPLRREDVEALLGLYRVEPQTRDAILRLHEAAGLAAWWDVYAEDVGESVLDLIWFESMATRIRVYCATVIDALLQIAEYARALHRSVEPDAPDEKVRRWVELRIMRQSILTGESPPTFEVILDEAVLRRMVGGPAVMAAQLRHLVSQADRGVVTLRVLPFDIGAHASPDGGFRILDLPEPLTEMVSAASAGGVLVLEPPRSQEFGPRYAALAEEALDPAASVELLAEAADELENA